MTDRAKLGDLADRIGNSDPGRQAELVINDPNRGEPLANSLEWGLAETWVGGADYPSETRPAPRRGGQGARWSRI